MLLSCMRIISYNLMALHVLLYHRGVRLHDLYSHFYIWHPLLCLINGVSINPYYFPTLVKDTCWIKIMTLLYQEVRFKSKETFHIYVHRLSSSYLCALESEERWVCDDDIWSQGNTPWKRWPLTPHVSRCIIL